MYVHTCNADDDENDDDYDDDDYDGDYDDEGQVADISARGIDEVAR